MTEFVTITKKDHISEKVTAYNHQTENEIKAKIKFKKISPKLVVLGLLDFMSYKKWNKLIESS